MGKVAGGVEKDVDLGCRGMVTAVLFDAMGERVIGKSGIVICR
jgi:hypothetical protein